MAFQYLQAVVSIVNVYNKTLVYCIACTVMNMIKTSLMVYEITITLGFPPARTSPGQPVHNTPVPRNPFKYAMN